MLFSQRRRRLNDLSIIFTQQAASSPTPTLLVLLHKENFSCTFPIRFPIWLYYYWTPFFLTSIPYSLPPPIQMTWYDCDSYRQCPENINFLGLCIHKVAERLSVQPPACCGGKREGHIKIYESVQWYSNINFILGLPFLPTTTFKAIH